MRIEDMAKWTVDELKAEVVRLSEECEKKQHEILDKNDRINELQSELDKMCDYNNDLKKQISDLNDIPELMTSDITVLDRLKEIERVHQDDCITINQLNTAIDVLVDRYANLRKIHGLK